MAALKQLAMLVRHWIDHNEGHRESYLEWRTKVEDQSLPVTKEALARVADLTAQANGALAEALAELQGDAALPPAEGHEHHHQR
jgi:hypothetical protein